jgi:hypothetical protein
LESLAGTTAHGRYQGVSDNAEGVQWKAGLDREAGTAWLGVNFEGTPYRDWPIARFTECELDQRTFLDLCGKLTDSSSLITSWTRDAWQAAARLPIAEILIGPTPITLDKLTLENWRRILMEAFTRLNPSRCHRGRALQSVTLKPRVRPGHS